MSLLADSFSQVGQVDWPSQLLGNGPRYAGRLTQYVDVRQPLWNAAVQAQLI